MGDTSELAKLGTWTVAMVVAPLRPDLVPDQAFLSIVDASNPNYTGWPIWMDTRGFSDKKAKPKVVEGAWQALTVSMATGWSDHVDFFRFDPRGEFLLVRILQDDMTTKVAPCKALDPVLVILRVAEAIAVGLTFVKELGWDLEHTKLGFAFKWTKLKARELIPWGQPNIIFSPGRTAYDDEVSTFIEVPANTPVSASAIAPWVREATRDLFILFDGYTFPQPSLENWVERLIERKL
jgi:hypothetical protein